MYLSVTLTWLAAESACPTVGQTLSSVNLLESRDQSAIMPSAVECSKPGYDRALGLALASLGLPQGNVKN